MFGVSFNPVTDPDTSVVVARFKTDVEAVQFALALHQASNVPHNVTVYDFDGLEGQPEMICHFFVPEVSNG